LIAGIESNPGPQLNNKNFLKIIHNNVCSLLPKLDLIEHEFQEYDVICISESHLDSHICKLEFGGLYITPTKNLSLLLFRISTQSISKENVVI
jgi:hypothetical protein